MSEEQIGATVTEAAPAESAPATETPVTDAAQSATSKPATAESVQTPNWDSDDNPHKAEVLKLRDRLAGTDGAARQLEAQRAALRQEREDWRRQQEAAQRQWAEDQSQRQLQAILDQGDPDDPAVKQLKAQVDEAKRQRSLEQQYQPLVQQQAQTLAQQQYSQFLLDTAQDWGLSPEEVQAAHQKSGGDYGAFRKELAGQVREKFVTAEVTKVRSEYDTKLKAQEERLKALERGSQRSPDTSTGQVASSNDEAIWLREYGEGSHDSPADHAKARRLLARYN